MNWTVRVSKKVQKQIDKLPLKVIHALDLLVKEIRLSGPIRGDWPNYSKLDEKTHHCHLKKGKPTYVAVWEIKENQAKLVEVIYVGSHEKAPY